MEILIHSTITLFKRHLPIDGDQEAILVYGLHLFIGSVLGYLWALLVAWFLGLSSYVVVIMFWVSILRVFSGGAHCSSLKNCIIYGAITMNGLALFTKFISPTTESILIQTFGILVFSLWSINKYAPADTPGKPIITKQQRSKLRTRSFVVLFLWFFCVMGWYSYFNHIHRLLYASSIGILWQSFTLSKIGYSFCGFFDKFLNIILKKEAPSL